MNQGPVVPIAIVGAGPYGLSIGAHLRHAGVDFRIFGNPMSRWRWHMPKGMLLKSDGFASNLSDPLRKLTLEYYCSRMGLPYGDRGVPVPLDTFTGYSLDFQRQLVPNVESDLVQQIDRKDDCFVLHLESGEVFRAARVVIATGLEHAQFIPPETQSLPSELLSHVSAHHDLDDLRTKDVIVIGGGQSALEAAALLSERGAAVRVIARAPAVAWTPPPKASRRSVYQRLRAPSSGLGAGLQLWMYSTIPGLFRYLPRQVRFSRVKKVLGPAGSWWLKDRVVDRLELLPGHVVTKAEARGGRAVLHVRHSDGQLSRLTADHVIAATGYRFALGKLPFLSSDLKTAVRNEQGSPVLSPHFESSVPGLYFTGLASAPAFGPAMRFLDGADYTARCVSAHLTRRIPSRLETELEFVHAARS